MTWGPMPAQLMPMPSAAGADLAVADMGIAQRHAKMHTNPNALRIWGTEHLSGETGGNTAQRQESRHENGLASQACKAHGEAHGLQKNVPTAVLVQVPSNSDLPLAARRGRPGPSRSAPGRESPSQITHSGGIRFSSFWRPAPHAAQHGLSEHDGRCGLATHPIRAPRLHVAPLTEGKGHRHQLERRRLVLQEPRCAAP